jgi:HPt (histidine-containing phosphotransfer) domain-containing protein
MEKDILKNETSTLTVENRIEKDNQAIDLALGESIVGTRERAMEMLAMLKSDIHDNLPKMKQYYQANQWSELKTMIHKFYGGVCFCGTPHLKTAAHDLDHVLKEKNRKYSEIENSFALFTTEIKRFLIAYERLI